MPALWHLQLTNWTGISIGAVHWYAKIGGRCNLLVERVLTAAQADELNAKDNSNLWAAGWTTNRFDTEHDARQAALAVWRKLCEPDGDALVEGSASYVEPQKPLAGPAKFVEIATLIYEACELVGWWDGPATGTVTSQGHTVAYDRDKAMTALCAHWDIVLEYHHVRRSHHERDETVVVVDLIDGDWTITEGDPCPT